MSDTIPTDSQMLSTHRKLSVLVSARLIEFLNARDKAMSLLSQVVKGKDADGKKLTDEKQKAFLKEALTALKSTKSH